MLLPIVGRTTATAASSTRRTLFRWVTRTAMVSSVCRPQLRWYAKVAPETSTNRSSGSNSSNDNGSGSGSANDTTTESKLPLPITATLTVTLVSSSPQQLLLELASTLQRMMSLTHRLGPVHANGSCSNVSDHVLLYSLSKNLPSEYLAEAVSLLRGSVEVGKQDEKSLPASKIACIGILSSPLSSSLISPSILKSEALGTASQTLYSASLSMLPGVNAIPFRSELPGRANVAVGRWVSNKPSWQQGSDRRADFLDDDKGVIPGVGRDWKEIWGRENVEGKVPRELDNVDPESVVSVVFFSDSSPQGLVEGLTSRFPQASILGLKAPPTPFETGRDQTLLYTLPSSSSSSDNQDHIYTDGAIGVALVAHPDAKGQPLSLHSRNNKDTIPSVTSSFQGLVPFGPRREVTSAQGNIISTLDHINAAQQFLRDIQTRHTQSEPFSIQSKPFNMTDSQTRQIASLVEKDQDFYIAIYSDSKLEENQQPPLVVSQIRSGHPSRGTLSIDCDDIDLGPGAGNQQATMKTFVQFLQLENSKNSTLISSSNNTRYLFIVPSSPPQSHLKQVSTNEEELMIKVENLFLVISERGWLMGKGKKEKKSDMQTTSSNVLKTDGSTVVSCSVPLATALFSF